MHEPPRPGGFQRPSAVTVHLLGHHPPPRLSLGEKGFQGREEQLREGGEGWQEPETALLAEAPAYFM